MNNLTTIYVVRHGESTFNALQNKEETESDGELGASLTDLGKEQAKKLARALNNINLDAVFSSDLARAKETAEIIASEKKLTVETNKLIGERGVWDYFRKSGYKKMDELREVLKISLSKLDERGKMRYKHTPSMESAEEGALRLLGFLKETAISREGEIILVVCHGNIMRSLLTYLGWAKYDELPNGSIENTGYFILETDGDNFSIKGTVGVNKRIGVARDF